MTSYSEQEWQTRKLRIDTQLKSLGWTIVPVPAQGPTAAWESTLHAHAVEELPTDDGPADYALFLAGKLFAILEAKRYGVDVQNVLSQAERYARAVRQPTGFVRDGYLVPLIFSTNGEQIWFRDLRHPLELARALGQFRSPHGVTDLLGRDPVAALATLAAKPNTHPKLRPYQRDAVDAVEKSLAARQKRMLVAMATGTGKTFVTVHQLYRLLATGVVRRVLFLVDRRALAVQAVRAFHSYECKPGVRFSDEFDVFSQKLQSGDYDGDDEVGETFNPKSLELDRLVVPSATDTFVYVCTIQRMAVNLFGRDAVIDDGTGDVEEIGDDPLDALPLPIHAFDLIVADECHRGYNAHAEATFRRTFDHFDAVKIGLTATPAPHTQAYFHNLVFTYKYEDAVREGYLVDYDVLSVASGVLANGVFLKEGELLKVIDLSTGKDNFVELEEERSFDAEAIERAITVPDTNRQILVKLKEFTDLFEKEHGRFPKTLIFASNDRGHASHAQKLTEMARQIYGRGDDFVEKITGKVDRPLRRVKEFRNRKDRPGIAITVDLLSTGVDVPDLEVIVFLRFVKSRILFVQMLGRGTRRSPDLPDKSHFTVVDCFGGTLLAYFRASTDMTEAPPDKPSKSIAEVIEDIWQNRDRDYNIRSLVKRLQRIDKEMSGEARALFAAFVKDGDLAAYATALPSRLKADFTNSMKLLRDAAFQKLLRDYPRSIRQFFSAEQKVDTVSAQWLVRGNDGKEYKPEDYLAAFERYVRENPDHVDAIRILVDSPRDWSMKALEELRARLSVTDPPFNESLLRRAHHLRYDKALVDIISMVKHAAVSASPLLTAPERIQLAFAALTVGRTLTTAQSAWLGRIQGHLVHNLSLSRDDFDTMPAFADYGGWGAANEVFDGALPDWIARINEAVAA